SAARNATVLSTARMDSLPDDCIFSLLKPNFSLSKLIRLRAVSTKWKKIAQKICLSKTELHLLSAVLDMVHVYKDADPYRLMKKADLRQLAPNLLTPSKTAKAPKADEFISSLFPHVTKLVCGLEDSGLSSGLFAALLVRQPGRPYHHQQAARE